MPDEPKKPDIPAEALSTESAVPAAVLDVAPSPHLSARGFSTRRMMVDVLIALVPAVGVAVLQFRIYAVAQLMICVAACLVAEMAFTAMRGRCWWVITDGSAVVTGVILALSLPWSTPWYVALVASVVAVGIGKIVFGGLGQNLFNPAMVGRAFVMICFASALGAKAYVAKDPAGVPDVVTRATPMKVIEDRLKEVRKARQNGLAIPAFAYEQKDAIAPGDLFFGTTNGSLGEVSALACLLGGLYLCLRRTASWEIPAGTILATAVLGGIHTLAAPDLGVNVLHHLLGGALLFGAFFIATDPVSSPLTPKGKWIFGIGIGSLVMLIRLLAGYPEGVMFAVLLMNAAVPLINRWTIPTPLGGPVPVRA